MFLINTKYLLKTEHITKNKTIILLITEGNKEHSLMRLTNKFVYNLFSLGRNKPQNCDKCVMFLHFQLIAEIISIRLTISTALWKIFLEINRHCGFKIWNILNCKFSTCVFWIIQNRKKYFFLPFCFSLFK